jgi:hypothetical protein
LLRTLHFLMFSLLVGALFLTLVQSCFSHAKLCCSLFQPGVHGGQARALHSDSLLPRAHGVLAGHHCLLSTRHGIFASFELSLAHSEIVDSVTLSLHNLEDFGQIML